MSTRQHYFHLFPRFNYRDDKKTYYGNNVGRGITICVLEVPGEGSAYVGLSACHPKDNFNKRTGKTEALKNALDSGITVDIPRGVRLRKPSAIRLGAINALLRADIKLRFWAKEVLEEVAFDDRQHLAKTPLAPLGKTGVSDFRPLIDEEKDILDDRSLGPYEIQRLVDRIRSKNNPPKRKRVGFWGAVSRFLNGS